MPWRDDMAIELPRGDPPGGGSDDGRSPDALRADILDELADHLDCAMNRELRTTDDEAEARRRVLSRFGDPARVARRLWLDAMKGRLMAMKISVGLNVLLAIVIVVVIWMMTNEIARSRDMAHMMMAEAQQTREMLERAEENQANAPIDWISVEIRVKDEQTHEPLSGFEIQLSGRILSESESATLKEVTDSNGMVSIGPIRPGSHYLQVEAPNGQTMNERITLLPLSEQSVEVEWVRFDFGERPVKLTFRAPDGVSYFGSSRAGGFSPEAVQYVVLDLYPQLEENDRKWKWPKMLVAVNANGESCLIPSNIDSHLFENEVNANLFELEYHDTLMFPTGRDYQVVDLNVFIQGENSGSIIKRHLNAGRNQVLELAANEAKDATWTIWLR